MDCPNCGGERWVCENHDNRPWPDGCECGAGMPCPACNVPAPNTAPAMPPGTVVTWSVGDGDGTFEGEPVKGEA